MEIRNFIQDEIDRLKEIYDKYEKFNRETRYKYDWRLRGIENQIDALQCILEKKSLAIDWEKCYQEDINEN